MLSEHLKTRYISSNCRTRPRLQKKVLEIRQAAPRIACGPKECDHAAMQWSDTETCESMSPCKLLHLGMTTLFLINSDDF